MLLLSVSFSLELVELVEFMGFKVDWVRKKSREGLCRIRSPWQMVITFSAILQEKTRISGLSKSGFVMVGRIT